MSDRGPPAPTTHSVTERLLSAVEALTRELHEVVVRLAVLEEQGKAQTTMQTTVQQHGQQLASLRTIVGILAAVGSALLAAVVGLLIRR